MQLSPHDVFYSRACILLFILIAIVPWTVIDVILGFLIFSFALHITPPPNSRGRTVKMSYDGIPLDQIGLRGSDDDPPDITHPEPEDASLYDAWASKWSEKPDKKH